jgi:hypothetical protein
MTSLDKKIALAVLVIAAIMSGVVVYYRVFAAPGERAVIEVDNRRVQTVILTPDGEERTITVQGVRGVSHIGVEGVDIYMIDSACPDKVCISMGKKSLPGDVIVCLPNRVVIKIQGPTTLP